MSQVEQLREACASEAYRVCAETRHVSMGDKVAAAIRTLPTPTAPSSDKGEVIEAPENGEPDPEWRAIRRAIDQFVGRVPVINKHRAVHNTVIAETVARLDASGDREAADVIVWQCWYRALDRERERFLLADAQERIAALKPEALEG